MSINKIETLLDRYYAGESSREEEQKLKEFLAGEQVPAHLLADRELILGLAGDTSSLEEFDATLLLNEVVNREARSSRGNRIWMLPWRSAVAVASILLIIGLGWFYRTTGNHTANSAMVQDTFEDPEQAYAEVKKALMIISGKMNQGSSQLASLTKVDKAFSQLNNLKPLEKVENLDPENTY